MNLSLITIQLRFLAIPLFFGFILDLMHVGLFARTYVAAFTVSVPFAVFLLMILGNAMFFLEDNFCATGALLVLSIPVSVITVGLTYSNVYERYPVRPGSSGEAEFVFVLASPIVGFAFSLGVRYLFKEVRRRLEKDQRIAQS